MDTIRAAVVDAYDGVFRIQDVHLDGPRHHEVLVEVRAVGLCHSDLHVAEGNIPFPLPIVLGHEVSGVVIETGPHVTTLSPGDHVVGSLLQTCRACRACREGRSYQCENPDATLRAAGDRPRLSRDGVAPSQGYGLGAFAERIVAHQNQLSKVPDNLPFPQAALLGCGVATGVGAVVNTASVHPGDTVVVIGAGGVGLSVVAGARLAGAARIVVIDLQPRKLELALTFGATDAINPSEVDAEAAVLAATGGGADHVFEAIGLKSTSEQAVRMARRGGAAYLIGLHKPGAKIEIDALRDLIRGQKRIQGVYMGSSDIERDIPLYADYYLQGRLDLDDLISGEIRLDQINEAYDELKKGSVTRSIITSF